MGEGREGDWQCNGCSNRNYAFRSFCNRCKQPRLFVDTKTPADSKWLPRIGDWICTGCTNNNYASREKCKKCGQPKEVAAMPAIAMTGASLPTFSHYFARPLGGQEHRVNIGLSGHGALSQPFSLSSNWSAVNPINQLPPVPKGWRNGDWICNCGFHNYSSRAQCKNCNASVPPALGTKRLASEESIYDMESKRLNLGNNTQINGEQRGCNAIIGSMTDPQPGCFVPYSNFSFGAALNWQAAAHLSQQVPTQAILGKGAKQWRNGDWMCTSCNNHNYASRSQCNRCKTQRDGAMQQLLSQPVIDAAV